MLLVFLVLLVLPGPGPLVIGISSYKTGTLRLSSLFQSNQYTLTNYVFSNCFPEIIVSVFKTISSNFIRMVGLGGGGDHIYIYIYIDRKIDKQIDRGKDIYIYIYI